MSLFLTLITLSSLGLIVYHYLLYPLLLVALRLVAASPVLRAPVTPSVSILIAAHNEAGIIARKLETTLALDYPQPQIILSSDGSTDATAEIARRYAASGVEVIESAERGGKGRALNRAAAAARGDILLISDANAFPEPDALRRLAEYFADPAVGCVSGAVSARTDADRPSPVAGSEGLYWRYEGFIKQSESAIASATGVVGSLLAIRRELFEPVPEGVVNDDSHLMHAVLRQGRRSIYAPEARAWRLPSRSAADERGRRARIAAGRWQHLTRRDAWPLRSPMTVFFLLSHKFLRLLLPVLMALALVGNALLVPLGGLTALTTLTLLGQLGFYALAGYGWWLERGGRRSKLPMLAYFVLNGSIATAHGLLRHLRGAQSVLWAKAER